MADKLGEAFIELMIQDATFQQQMRQQQQRAALAASLISQKVAYAMKAGQAKVIAANAQSAASAVAGSTKLRAAQNAQQVAGVNAVTSALNRQTNAANAASVAYVRMTNANSAATAMAVRSAAKANAANVSRNISRNRFNDQRFFTSAKFDQDRSNARRKFMDDIAFMNAKGRVKLTLQSEKFKQELRQAKRLAAMQGGSSGNVLGSVIGGGLILGGMAMAANQMQSMTSQAFAYNSAIERSTVSFSVLLGSQSRAVSLMDQLRTFAAKTPFELPTLNQAAVSLLATKKIAQSQVLPILTKLGDAAAGSSEGFAAMPRITRAVAQMLTKGKIQAEEMMQLSEAGVPAWSALAEQMGKSTAEVQKMGEQGKLGIREIMLLVDGLGKTYEGLADKQSKTFEGLSSTIKDNVGKAFGDAFKPLFDLTKGGMSKLVAFMDSKAFTKFIDGIASGMQTAIDFTTRLVNSPLAQGVAKFAALTAGALAFVGTISLAGSAVSMIFASAPLIAFSAALGGIAVLVQRAFSGPEGAMFIQMLQQSWGLLKEIGTNLSDAFMPALQQLGGVFAADGGIQTSFNSFLGMTLGGLQKVLDFASLLTTNFGMTWDLMKTSAAFAISYIGDRFIFLFDTSLPTLIAGLVEGLAAAGGSLVDSWRTLFEALVLSVGVMFNGMIDAQKIRLDGLAKAFEAVKKGKLGSAVAEIAKSNLAATAMQNKAIGDAATTFASKSAPAFGRAAKAFKDAFDGIVGNSPAFEMSDATKQLGAQLGNQMDAMKAARDAQRNARFNTRAELGNAFRGMLGGVGGLGSVIGDALTSGGKLAIEAKPIADVIGAVDKFASGIGMFFGPKEEKTVKDRKSEFVGLTEMNKKIQASLGKMKDDADKKKALKLAEDQKKLQGDIAKATDATVTAVKGLGKLFGYQ